MMLQRRAICAFWAFTVCFSVLADLRADDLFYLRGTELTSQFEIQASTLRKSIRNGEFTFDLAVTNQSKQDFRGPLALIIEKTGVESLLLKQADHQFVDDGQGFLELLNNSQTLKSGETLKLRRVRLKSTEDLETDPADQFSPVARIYEVKTTEQKIAQRRGAPKGFPGGIPLRLPERVAGQDAGQPDAADEPEVGLKPVPDPIGDTGEEEQVTDTGVEPLDNQGDRPGPKERPHIPTEEELEAALETKNAWEEKLFKIEGVHAVGRAWVGEEDAGILVKVTKFDQKKTIPSQLDGIPVEVYVAPQTELLGRGGQIGYWRELGLCETGDPTEFYDRPIRIGVSGWNSNILICATGTLGCRLENSIISTEKYVLSNSHVLADRGLGTAAVDDPVIQPGYLDFSCSFPPMGVVGGLSAWSTYNLTGNNTIDAAVAATQPLWIGTATPCNGYGVPRETTVVATIGMEVMKYGRTTRFTTGTVLADNVTSLIFDGVNLVTFVNQIEILSDPEFAGFGGPGDSGSLIVTRDGRNPVALLFAGSSFSTLGNPIDTVLTDMSTAVGAGLRVDGQP